VGLVHYRKRPPGSPGGLYLEDPLARSRIFLGDAVQEVKNGSVAGDTYYIRTTDEDDDDASDTSMNLNAVAAFGLLKTGSGSPDPRIPALLNKFFEYGYPNSQDRLWYGWHYAAQACFHLGGIYWEYWNSQMVRVLPLLQHREEGPRRGSWVLENSDWPSRYTGRVFPTVTACLCLQVYYRFPRSEHAGGSIPGGFPGPPPVHAETEHGHDEGPAEP
jgi:hypothetical protein